MTEEQVKTFTAQVQAEYDRLASGEMSGNSKEVILGEAWYEAIQNIGFVPTAKERNQILGEVKK